MQTDGDQATQLSSIWPFEEIKEETENVWELNKNENLAY